MPTDWVSDVRGATEDRYFEIAGHLPGEAAEALLEYAATGMLPETEPRPGTGKTVVALHRAARLAAADDDARVLLTTFSQPLANLLRRKLDVLIGSDSFVVPRVTVTPYRGVAEELYQLAFGRRPHVAPDDVVRATLLRVAEELKVTEFTERFLVSEWANVVDA